MRSSCVKRAQEARARGVKIRVRAVGLNFSMSDPMAPFPPCRGLVGHGFGALVISRMFGRASRVV